jgi:hypothetical protein
VGERRCFQHESLRKKRKKRNRTFSYNTQW